MNSNLTLKYEFSRDGDDFGWLMAQVDTPQFKGRNGMWVQWQDMTDFAALLSTYPINADSPLVEDWGFSEQEKYTEITKIAISPFGLTGGLVAEVVLANYYEPTNRCSTRFETDYPSVRRFREEIDRMMRTRAGSAVLYGAAEAN